MRVRRPTGRRIKFARWHCGFVSRLPRFAGHAMRIKPSPATAAVAGVWTATGMAVRSFLAEAHFLVGLPGYAITLLFVFVFIVAPVALFVFGLDARPPKLFQPLDSEEWGRFRAAMFRALCWFIAGGATLIVLSFVRRLWVT
jgi:hypothetical protein